MGALEKSLFWDPTNIRGKEQKKVFTVSQSFMSTRYSVVSIHLLKDLQKNICRMGTEEIIKNYCI